MTILSLIATCLGIFLSVLNLVVFLKEKDRSHVRTALLITSLGALLIGLITLPRFAPGVAEKMAHQLPPHPWVQAWLGQSSEQPAPTLAGSLTPEWQHNLFGGISGLKLICQFSSTTPARTRVLSYRLKVATSQGETPRTFDRVLSEPVVVEAGATAKAEIDVDGEILDAFLKRLDNEHPGAIEVTWTAADERGITTSF